MNHLLFIIGDNIIMNEDYKAYILRVYKDKFKEVNSIRMQSSSDKELPFLLEKISLEYDYITIFVANEYYAVVAKILATLCEDVLVLKDETLVPDKAFYDKNSFVCDFKDCKINLIKTDTKAKLPKLLGELNLNFSYFSLLGIDEESALILLEPLAKSYEIDIKSTMLTDNLTLIKAFSLQYGKMDGFLASVQKLFDKKFFKGSDPIKFIVDRLLERKIKVSFVESCTGGLCASELTKIDGVSEIFEGSIITYSNRLKHEWVGVSNVVLEQDGEYSEKCIYYMLKGIFKTAKPDFALAISGVAGDENDNKNGKDIKSGTIYIGAMFKNGTYIQEVLNLCGDREFKRRQAMLKAFYLMPKLRPELFEL
ncbi:CinA family protein [Campylobacter sp. LR185c]|uniref:CinA family protein n=1 Tax=Campylobacter sp. LR185c TaxID=2014525 RepID=UPI001237E266|nr:CinA family protein [Campylobacter sp. LR185c]KAA6224649.1 CinA family protein [Campylobacter sp. LR185c]KAA8604012.1 damage-inducible protein CinA [Campylobacter sp. LR185c]